MATGLSQTKNGPASVVMLVPGFPAGESDTSWVPPLQIYVKALSRRNSGLRIHVISFQYPYTRTTYSWNGVTVHALAGQNRRFPIRFATWVRATLLMRRLLRSHHVIAIHSHWLAECTFMGALIAKVFGIRHIATIHGMDALAGNLYLKYLPLPRMIITAGSENSAKAFFATTGRRADCVIPFGLDPDTGVAEADPPEPDIDILGVGSLTPNKNFRSFVDVILRLQRNNRSLRCAIVGDGPERPMLERHISDNGLQGTVRLEGSRSREWVLETMRRSRILLHTSRYEGQGYVFLEALGSGMRVVCHDVGFPGDSVNVYRCMTEEEMIQTLERLLRTPSDRTEREVIGIDSTAEAFEKLYGITPP